MDCQLTKLSSACCDSCGAADRANLEALQDVIKHNYSTTGEKGRPLRRSPVLERAALAAYATWPGVRGCVTKLLTGRGCNALAPSLGARDVARARLRLRDDFAFVGLTEQWDA